MKRILELTVGITLIMLPSAWAGTASRTVPINATTLNSCVIVLPGGTSIDFDNSAAYTASGSYSGDNGNIPASVYCNKLTPLTQRSVTGISTTITPGEPNAVDVVLTKYSPTANGDTIKVRAWFTVGLTTPSTNDSGFVGAVKYRQILYAGWKNGQWGASTGSYSGSFQFSVTF